MIFLWCHKELVMKCQNYLIFITSVTIFITVNLFSGVMKTLGLDIEIFLYLWFFFCMLVIGPAVSGSTVVPVCLL